MLNLLIREDRHKIRKEYLFRFLLVLLFFLIITMLILGVVLFSFYTKINSESKIVEDQFDVVKNSSDSKNINELVSLNKDIENKISQFNILDFDQSDILEEVLSKNEDGINLNLINVNLNYPEEGVFADLEIRGISRSRNELVIYQESLLSSELFESVKIPFSSFAQNSDIPFTISIKTVELNNYFENEK